MSSAPRFPFVAARAVSGRLLLDRLAQLQERSAADYGRRSECRALVSAGVIDAPGTLRLVLKRRSIIETAGSRRERPPRPNGVMAPSAANQARSSGRPRPYGG